MSFDRARAVADAVLFEGYALYPYRPTSTKNQLRWQFGVLAPRAASEAAGADPWWLESQCLVSASARIAATVRFLRLRRRRVETPDGAPIASLELDGQLLVPWDEGELCELELAHDLAVAHATHSFTVDGGETLEAIDDARGQRVARVRRTRAPLALTVIIAVEPTDADGLCKLRLRVENVSACADPDAPRDQSL
ncbi:MAG TPA: hypothetical protein VF334_12385, partial [Polyangia bacterium]